MNWIDLLYWRALQAINDKMDRILTTLDQVKAQEKIMSAELEALEAQVKENEEVEQSALVLINGLADRVKELADEVAAAGADPAKLVALAAELDASAANLAAAVVANTPAEPV